MAKAKMRKQLEFQTADTPGELGKVCELCGSAGVNIEAVCAYGMEGKALFMMCTSDNAKAVEDLKGVGFESKETDVVTLEVEDAPGKMAEVAKAIGEAGVNLSYIYGSAGAPGQSPFIVLNSDNNAKVVELFA